MRAIQVIDGCVRYIARVDVRIPFPYLGKGGLVLKFGVWLRNN